MPGSFYGPALARIHQKKFESLSTRRAPALHRLLRRSGVTQGRVLDLACGPGGWAQELTRRGYRVTGIDISPAMIALAARRVPQARFICRPMQSARLPACDAITGLGEPFNYLLRSSDVQRVFRRSFRALPRGGVLLFDTQEPPQTLGLIRRESNAHIGRMRMVASIVEDARRSRIVRTISVTETRNGRTRVTTETHRQRMYAAREMVRWLRATGFRVEIVRRRALALSPRHAFLVARKP